jgi:hypothetical protein
MKKFVILLGMRHPIAALSYPHQSTPKEQCGNVVKGKFMSTISGKKGKKFPLAFALLLTVITLSLVACGDPLPEEIIPTITLSVNKTNLPDGGDDVILTAKITNGAEVTSVTFKRDKGAAIPAVTSPNGAGAFVTTVNVTETTQFTAEATGPAGVGKSSESKTVTVAPVDPKNDPKAPSSSLALKGFAGITLTTGNPAGLSVVVSIIPGVTGNIDGNVKAETVKSAKGVDVMIEAGEGVLVFSYSANAPGKDSFHYTVTKTSREAKGKIDIDIQALPSDVEIIDGSDTVATINGSGKSNILLAKDVNCTVDGCIRLDAGQTLAGTMVIDGLTITNSAKPKILASIPNTRKSGTASCGTVDALLASNPDAFENGEEYDPRPNCVETRVIILHDNTTVEGIEITSPEGVTDEANTYFIAIYARGDRTDSGENILDGDIKIKDVTINRSNGKPIYVKYTFPNTSNPTPSIPEFGNYTLEIDGLDLNDANDTLVIGNPNKLVFKNSTIDLMQPVGEDGGSGPQPFGDNSGVQIVNYNGAGDITLDNVDVFMESPRYRIDFGGEYDNCTPVEILNDTAFTSSVTTNLTVRNSDITFGTSHSGVYAMKLKSNGGTINISNSTNNKSVRGVLKDPTNGGVINGNIIVNP